MNKIDAFFVTFSAILVWLFATILLPSVAIVIIYALIGCIALGLRIGSLYGDLRFGSDKKMIRDLFENLDTLLSLTNRYAARNGEFQAEIDRLMLEYCPEEMTPAQLANWAAHQGEVSPEMQKKIDAALH